MAERTVILDVVGLTPRLLGPAMPRLTAFAAQHGRQSIRPALPAVTCTAQSTYLTGLPPAQHGCVANGWYDRALAEHHFWKQSNALVQGPKLWETCRAARPGFTCAKLFWWYNMYSSADWSVTPRPLYPADGRKVFDIHTHPADLRPALKRELGAFPFPTFWGPMAGLPSSQWIAASARWIEEQHQPDLSLVYLPHLDYNLQRLGPDDPRCAEDCRAIDTLVGELLDFYAQRGVRPVVLSEYGIVPVRRAVALNRVLRARSWLTVKDELGRETLDCGTSAAFAIADHQVAHIYVRDPALMPAVRAALAATPGVAQVLDRAAQRELGLDHARSGDLVALAEEDSWFTYYYWEDDAKAPDFARCVDIHRKYGYDPVELFVDPQLTFPKLRVATKLLKKALGFRMLMDVIPLDPSLVKGSHGVCPRDERDWPVLLGAGASDTPLAATAVHDKLLDLCLR
ncbi:MAG TPA: alkaline phosphatase family protein [Opitutaceae bacterium]|nr:alkaline phosphatase family protein [Opitutaceae bacterium]